jgi:hypothetical protein
LLNSSYIVNGSLLIERRQKAEGRRQEAEGRRQKAGVIKV